MPQPSAATLAAQVGDKVRPSATLEVGRSYSLGSQAMLRPFGELRGGVETYARVGVELVFGAGRHGDLLVRDPVTGFRYRTAGQAPRGASLLLGADIAKVWDSTYLPKDLGYTLTDTRNRLRAGVNWQGDSWSMFYGLTWLGREFVGQSDDQITGAIHVDVSF